MLGSKSLDGYLLMVSFTYAKLNWEIGKVGADSESSQPCSRNLAFEELGLICIQSGLCYSLDRLSEGLQLYAQCGSAFGFMLLGLYRLWITREAIGDVQLKPCSANRLLTDLILIAIMLLLPVSSAMSTALPCLLMRW